MDELRDIYRKLSDYRKGDHVDERGRPKSVSYLAELKNREDLSANDMQIIYTLLAGECNLYKLREEERQIHEEFIQKFPENPVSWIGIANLYMRNSNKNKKAIDYPETAISVSRKTKNLVRMSLNTATRAHIIFENWGRAEEILQELLEYQKPEDSSDEGVDLNILHVDGIEHIREDILVKLRQLAAGTKDHLK